ncbi:ABC transporter substrate-binding protein [Salinifilum ghardaiensis]
MRALLALLTVGLLATACGAPAEEAASRGGERVDNCGRAEVFDEPPQRVLSLNQHATEILLALGLGDRIVGTAFPDDRAPPPEIAAEYAQVPVVAPKYPSAERILQIEPDLVVGGYASAFDETEGRGRDALEELGIPTLLLSESCVQRPAGMGALLDDIRMFGRVLDLEDGAARLAADIRGRVQAVQRRVADEEPVDVFVYDSGEQAPMTLGGHGVGNDAVRRAGGRNVFADVPQAFADVSWEQVAARKPDAIVLVDYLAEPVEGKRAYLSGHPLVGRTPAARAGRFSTIPLVELTEGIRFPGAVERLAADLHGAP